MHLQRTADHEHYRTLGTAGLRENFLITDLFASGELRLRATDADRAIVGAAVPTGGVLELTADDSMRAEFFCQRRELGVINLGAAGAVTVDGTGHELQPLDVLYVGRGSQKVAFASAAAADPARFYLVSYPAHAEHPTTLVPRADANRVELGGNDTANERVIYQSIHEGGAQSCQLVMGYTDLAVGSVWNTMPPHTHDRRSEVYLYFDVPEDHRVLHLMGEPQETRGLWMNAEEAVISPPWSIHGGCGTSNYKFVWAMGGENQRFDDMDPAPVPTLR